VENRLFSLALFEYYLDKISSYDRRLAAGDGGGPNDPAPTGTARTVTLQGGQGIQRLKHTRHPDAWTLHFMSIYGAKIAKAIDCDSSGFIRISEANDFTATIPDSWNLLQWLAYHANGEILLYGLFLLEWQLICCSPTGWAYEIRVYQARMHNIFLKMCALQTSGSIPSFLLN